MHESEPYLALLMENYEARSRVEASREEVCAVVERRVGFQNAVRTGQGHAFLIDEPKSFGGGGEAADPAEILLSAVGASLSVTLTAHAALQNIPLSAVKIELRSWMDPMLFFKPVAGQTGGLQDLEIVVTVASSAPRTALDGLIGVAMSASPVVQSLNPMPHSRLIVETSA